PPPPAAAPPPPPPPPPPPAAAPPPAPPPLTAAPPAPLALCAPANVGSAAARAIAVVITNRVRFIGISSRHCLCRNGNAWRRQYFRAASPICYLFPTALSHRQADAMTKKRRVYQPASSTAES